MSQNSWQDYFDKSAYGYMAEDYTKNWKAEVDFLETELDLQHGNRILDVGCGTGRHSIEFARRGYQVTGLDFSVGMLAEARKLASSAGVDVEWILEDATNFTTDKTYDGAICMLEAAIGLIPVDGTSHTHDLAVMSNVRRALKKGGKFVVEVPNAYRMIRQITPEAVEQGHFDLERSVHTGDSTYDTRDGEEKRIKTSTRNYVPSEINLMLQQSGFVVDGFSGSSSKRTALQLDDYTIIVIAHKT